MQISELQLQSKADIPFEPAKIIIHQPTCKQIGVIGENIFWLGCQYINFSKNILKEEDKVRLEKLSDFEVLMTMMRSQNTNFRLQKVAMLMVLSLLFPDYQIHLTPIQIKFSKQGENDKFIDRGNYEQFKDVIKQIFCLKQMQHGKDYNPKGALAESLAKKFREREKKLAKLKGQSEGKTSINLLSRYISILSVGLQKDKNELLQYSIFQLFDEYHRFMLREESQIIFRIKLAGGKDVKDAQDWMQDIHSNSNDDNIF